MTRSGFRRLAAGLRARRQPWHAGLLGMLLLAALTLLLTQTPGRYRVVVPSLLENLDFAHGGAGWSAVPRGGARLLETTPATVVLDARGLGRTVFIARRLGAAKGRYDHVRIGVDLRVQALVPGNAAWQRANFALISVDARGKRLWYWPRRVASIAGTTFWRRYQRSIPLAATADNMWLVAYVAARSGRLMIKGLAVQGVVESTPYRWLDRALVGGWVLLGLWALMVLGRRAQRDPIRWSALLCGALIVVGGITPQPQLRNGIDLGVYQMRRALASARALLPAERPSTVPMATGPSVAAPKAPPRAAARGQDRRSVAADAPRSLSRRADFRWAHSDKRAHLAAFALLTLLVLVGYRQRSALNCVVILLALGASIEAVQALSITRESEWLDLGNDAAGILFGAALVMGLRAILRARRRRARS